jgi:hypothetical protein
MYNKITTIRQKFTSSNKPDKLFTTSTDVHVDGVPYTFIENHKDNNVSSVYIINENQDTVKDVQLLEAISNHLDNNRY